MRPISGYSTQRVSHEEKAPPCGLLPNPSPAVTTEGNSKIPAALLPSSRTPVIWSVASAAQLISAAEAASLLGGAALIAINAVRMRHIAFLTFIFGNPIELCSHGRVLVGLERRLYAPLRRPIMIIAALFA